MIARQRKVERSALGRVIRLHRYKLEALQADVHVVAADLRRKADQRQTQAAVVQDLADAIRRETASHSINVAAMQTTSYLCATQLEILHLKTKAEAEAAAELEKAARALEAQKRRLERLMELALRRAAGELRKAESRRLRDIESAFATRRATYVQ